MSKPLRKLSLVKLRKKWVAEPHLKALPFYNDMPLIFLGEIPNMPEHGVFVGYQSGRVYSGLHIFQFIELSKNKVYFPFNLVRQPTDIIDTAQSI